MTTPAAKREPKLHSVRIHIRGTGFAYTTHEDVDAAAIHVRAGDRVQWNCDHGNYTVLFKGRSPFREVAVHGRKGAQTVEAEVTEAPGRYTYAVTVALADGGLIVDDPIVIIDDDGD